MDKICGNSANHENRAQNDQYFFIIHLLSRGPPNFRSLPGYCCKQYVYLCICPGS
jgi:hypothetical protein